MKLGSTKNGTMAEREGSHNFHVMYKKQICKQTRHLYQGMLNFMDSYNSRGKEVTSTQKRRNNGGGEKDGDVDGCEEGTGNTLMKITEVEGQVILRCWITM